MKSLNKSLSQVAWAAAALFLATVQGASAQATTPAPAAPHAHHMRYIIVGVLVLIVIIFFIMRARNTKKATT
jgi:hypothetical protein